MEIDELKLRIVKVLNSLIDVYYADNDFIDKLANSTLKVLVSTNVDKIDSFINLFIKPDGTINIEELVNAYSEQFPDDGIKFDIRDYVKSDFIRGILPNKFLLVSRDDLMKLIEKK